MWRYKPTKISLIFLLSLCNFCNFSNGLCVITCLYVHAHGKCACNTYYWHWHVLLLCVTSSSFDFTTYYYSPICYYHLTLNDKITVCTFLSSLIKAIDPISHHYIIWIAQWALQNQTSVKRNLLCTKKDWRKEVWMKR